MSSIRSLFARLDNSDARTWGWQRNSLRFQTLVLFGLEGRSFHSQCSVLGLACWRFGGGLAQPFLGHFCKFLVVSFYNLLVSLSLCVISALAALSFVGALFFCFVKFISFTDDSIAWLS